MVSKMCIAIRRLAAAKAIFATLAIFCAFPGASLAQDVQRFELRLKSGTLDRGPAVIKVMQGGAVELAWSSDRPVEIHLHGYDVLLRVGSGETGVMSFQAKATGRFPVTLHQPGKPGGHDHRAVTYLEVHPE